MSGRWVLDTAHLGRRWRPREREADRIERILADFESCYEPEPVPRKASVISAVFSTAHFRGTAT